MNQPPPFITSNPFKNSNSTNNPNTRHINMYITQTKTNHRYQSHHVPMLQKIQLPRISPSPLPGAFRFPLTVSFIPASSTVRVHPFKNRSWSISTLKFPQFPHFSRSSAAPACTPPPRLPFHEPRAPAVLGPPRKGSTLCSAAFRTSRSDYTLRQPTAELPVAIELLIGVGFLHPVQNGVVFVVHHRAETTDVEVSGHLGERGEEKVRRRCSREGRSRFPCRGRRLERSPPIPLRRDRLCLG